MHLHARAHTSRGSWMFVCESCSALAHIRSVCAECSVYPQSQSGARSVFRRGPWAGACALNCNSGPSLYPVSSDCAGHIRGSAGSLSLCPLLQEAPAVSESPADTQPPGHLLSDRASVPGPGTGTIGTRNAPLASVDCIRARTDPASAASVRPACGSAISAMSHTGDARSSDSAECKSPLAVTKGRCRIGSTPSFDRLASPRLARSRWPPTGSWPTGSYRSRPRRSSST